MSGLDLRSIAAALHGEVQGRRVMAPGPNHSRRDRSLSVALSDTAPGGFVVTSFADDPFDLCRDYVASMLGLPGDFWRTRSRGDGAASRHRPPSAPREGGPPDLRRVEQARRIWAETREPRGTVVERYLASRGLSLPEGATDIRFHPDCPWGDKATGRTIFVPAMVAAMRGIEGNLVTAVHRTRLTPEGAKVDRMMLGHAAGAAIKIDSDDAVSLSVTIGEGIETCLAARQLGLAPVWALGSASSVGVFPVLRGVETLVVLGEDDAANRAATARCASRWLEAGLGVERIDPAYGKDMNDALRQWVEHAG